MLEKEIASILFLFVFNFSTWMTTEVSINPSLTAAVISRGNDMQWVETLFHKYLQAMIAFSSSRTSKYSIHKSHMTHSLEIMANGSSRSASADYFFFFTWSHIFHINLFKDLNSNQNNIKNYRLNRNTDKNTNQIKIKK